jgi:hypothetical protein
VLVDVHHTGHKINRSSPRVKPKHPAAPANPQCKCDRFWWYCVPQVLRL